MPSVRLAASRTTANASGNSLSNDPPPATRCLNSSVLARNASSPSFSNSGSSALMRVTVLESWRSTRSLRLPKRLVRARLNIDLPDWVTECPQQARTNQAYYYMPANARPIKARLIKARPSEHADSVNRDGVGNQRIQGLAAAEPGVLPMIAHKGQRIDHSAVVPDLEMHVRSGRTAGGTGIGDHVAH